MRAPVVTGADIFRVKKILTAAEIRAIATTPVLIAPRVPGKSMLPVMLSQKFNFGTEVWTPSGTALIQLYYGPLNSGPVVLDQGAASLFAALDQANQSRIFEMGIVWNNASPDNLIDVQGIGLYAVQVTGDYNSGSALTATVDPANKGLLYVAGDTGTIQVTSDVTDPTYTVTGTGAGGLVTTVTVAGGTGVTVGGPFATTVVTGSGDGNLQLSIASITTLGDGTLEIDLLYQPI